MTKRSPKKIYQFSDVSHETYGISQEMIFNFIRLHPKFKYNMGQMLKLYKKCFPSTKIRNPVDLLRNHIGGKLFIFFNRKDVIAFCFADIRGEELSVYQPQFLKKMGYKLSHTLPIPIIKVSDLCVNPEYRRQGRCVQLITYTIEQSYTHYKREKGLKKLYIETRPIIILDVAVGKFKKSDKSKNLDRNTAAIKCYKNPEVGFKLATNLNGKWSKFISNRFTKEFLERYCKNWDFPVEFNNPSDPLYQYVNVMILVKN